MPYTLTLEPAKQQRLATGWLWLGLGALIIAGIFSILLVLSRVPQAQDFIPWLDFFHTSIVIHVDMSVLIWFLSYGCLMWVFTTRRLNSNLGWLALGLAVTGTLVIGASPFLGAADPLMNNYVPVLRHPLFFTGLGLFGTGVLLQVLLALKPDGFRFTAEENSLRLGIYLSVLITVMAIISLGWSYLEVPTDADDHAYFEYLFWGGGHVVQFAYTLLMLVAWLWLYSSLGLALTFSARIISLLLIAGAIPVVLAPVIQALYGSFSPEYRMGFTLLMRYGGGIAALPIGLLMIFLLYRQKQALDDSRKPLESALKTSILLFGAGGILGFLTHGVNTIIPAHYHGSIVGVTLAFMGLTYYLLPRLGYEAPTSKIARRQPWIYAWGQFIHISGLAVSGAMGIQRKTAGAAQGLDSMSTKIAMGVMGMGGLIAIIGGILFLVICLKIISQGRKPD
jgi:cytochrome c oxidase subunit 1